MTKRTICFYRTEWGAHRFQRDLEDKHPDKAFAVYTHPSEFGWTVGAQDNDGRLVAYVAPRPRNFAVWQ